MRNKEVFIGAWVETDFGQQMVTQIPNDATVRTGDGSLVCIQDLKPIPITDELLEKIGFNYIQNKFGGHYMLFDFLGVFIKTDGDCWKFDCNRNGLFMFKLHFVHELQMALTLNGIDKEIML